MESISIDGVDSQGGKGNYVELSSLVFEGLSLKLNRHFIDVKILSGYHQESTRKVIKSVLV